MRDPVWESLNTARQCIERLVRDHRTVTAAMARGFNPAKNGATPANVDPEGSVEWTETEAAMLRRVRSQAGRYQHLTEQALVALLEADTIRGLNVTADTPRLAVQDRCDGGAGDWADPTCERLSVCKRWVEGTQLALCDACDRRRRRFDAREEKTA